MQQNMMGQNIIITEPSSNLRALGRNALKDKWQIAIITVIVYSLCITVPPAVLNALFGVNLGDLYSMQYGYNVGVDAYSVMYNSMPSYSALSGIYVLLVTGAFTLGITLFFLASFRRQQVGVSDIFLGFEKFGKALGLMLFQTLFIVLWSLLFIIPGIIASIRYSQAFFILADDPNKSVRQCMNESKIMMKGNKTKYFCLSISFIGWCILAALPGGVIEGIASAFYAPAGVQSVIAIITSLFMVPVTVYMYSTFAGFYEILAGHLIKETAPAPVYPDAVPVLVDNDLQTPAEPAEESEEETKEVSPAENPADMITVSAIMEEKDASEEAPAEIQETPAEPQENPAADDDDFFPKEVN